MVVRPYRRRTLTHPLKLPRSASQRLVATMLAMARGSRNFQPKPINWS
jgi:hypothetical protein